MFAHSSSFLFMAMSDSMSVCQIPAAFVPSGRQFRRENLSADWLSQHSITQCCQKKSTFSTVCGEAMEAMDAATRDLNCVYHEIHIAQSEIPCNHVFSFTLYVILWHSSLV